MTDIGPYIEEHLEEALEQLREYVALASVSAQGQSISETAEFVRALLASLGATVAVLKKEPPGNPVVVGELAGDSAKTLLLYNHYDVQPAEPFELWTSPPFELRRDGDFLYGRGICDNKGHLIARLLALRALQGAHGGRLPITVKFLIEGDEEIGSAKLLEFVQRHRERLSSDVCLHEGGSVDRAGRPVVTLGVKGILAVQLHVRTAARDSHSSLAATVPNAAWRLVWALASLKDADERVLIPGFYDDARGPTAQEDKFLRDLPAEEELLLQSLELRDFVCGVRGYDYQRRLIFSPTCTINGLSAGYEGPGMKTVLPAEATAKVDFRLVPDQDPAEITELLRRHLAQQGFDDIDVTTHEGELPARTDADDPFVALVRSTARAVYGEEPVMVPNMEATQPLHPMMSVLGVPMASSGIGNPESRIHAPDENIRIGDFIAGTKHVAAIIEALGKDTELW